MENFFPRVTSPPMASLASVDLERFRLINSILMTILASDVAESTFAQIIDGIPTRISFEDNTAMRPSSFEISSRDEPTQQSRLIFREFCNQLQPASMTVDSKVGSFHESGYFITNSCDQLRQLKPIRIPPYYLISFRSDF